MARAPTCDQKFAVALQFTFSQRDVTVEDRRHLKAGPDGLLRTLCDTRLTPQYLPQVPKGTVFR